MQLQPTMLKRREFYDCESTIRTKYVALNANVMYRTAVVESFHLWLLNKRKSLLNVG